MVNQCGSGSETVFDYAVIGKGLIGAAAARSLSAESERVVVIGPDEPADLATHDGIYASHYDQGRITRVLDEDLIWGTLAQRSIRTYSTIEAESGISFHHPVGAMRVGHDTPDQISYITHNRRVGEALGATFQTYSYEELTEKFPYISVAPDAIALHETGGAGFINPRTLIQAQLQVARQRGATLVPDIVEGLSVDAGLCTLQTRSGETYRAEKVLITTGGFTNHFPLVGRPLAWTVVAEPILLAELTEASMKAIADLPAFMYRAPQGSGYLPAYLVPPVAYPDGRTYLKIGIGNRRDRVFDSLDAIIQWFQAGPDSATQEQLHEVLLALLPGLDIVSTQVKPCILTFTRTNYPYVDQAVPDAVWMAVGGCGYAGKSSVEIGHMAAQMVIHGRWAYDLDAAQFKAVYANEVAAIAS